MTALLAARAATTPARAEAIDPNFTESTWISDPLLASATVMAWAPDGTKRLFVARQIGEIRIVKDGKVLPAPFATITPIHVFSECGLIGLTFDPDFLVNKYVYAFVCVSDREQQIIRYTANGDVGDDKTTIVGKLPTAGNNHDGGAIAFGRDGKLYWGIGDLGNRTGVDADLSSMAAKIGRANSDGSSAADNPFADGPGPNNEFIWARGFRNPFSFTFQPATGLLFVNDVGTNHEQIFITRRGDHAGWSLYEGNQPAGFIKPVFKYRTNDVDTWTFLPPAMSGAIRAGGTVTFTTSVSHNLVPGEKLTVMGVADSSFNGLVSVRTVPSDTSFTVAQAGPDAVSGGGTGRGLALGGAVTGAAFYDATEFPAAYRGNYFTGDYNHSRVMRLVLDGNNTVVDFHAFVSAGHLQQVDVKLGPDGSLYYISHRGSILRASYKAVNQGVVVSPAHLWMTEGRPAVFSVRLAIAPRADTTVTVFRATGDADLTVQSGAALTFSTENWRDPQAVTLLASRDLDTADDIASFAVSSGGVTEMVSVFVRDLNHGPPPDAGADALPDTPVDAPAPDAPSGDGGNVGGVPLPPPDGRADGPSDRSASDADLDGAADRRADAAGSNSEGCDCRLGSGGRLPGLAPLLIALALAFVGRRRL